MADLPPFREMDEEREVGATSATSVWLKVLFATMLIGLILAFIGLHLAGVFGPGAHG